MHAQPHPRSRVRLLTSIASSLVLVLLTFGAAPAPAADASPRTTPAPSAQGRASFHTSSPAWVGRRGTATVPLPQPSNANVDWQWLRGGWEVKFNWAESRQMSRGFSYCTAIAALLPTGITQAVAASCGLLWIMADIGVANGKCVKIFVPLSLINTSIGYWSCHH